MESEYSPQQPEQSITPQQPLALPAPGEVLRIANEHNKIEITTRENGEIRLRVADNEHIIFSALVHEHTVRIGFDSYPAPEISPLPITLDTPAPGGEKAQQSQPVEQAPAQVENREKQKAVNLYGNVGLRISHKNAKDGKPMVSFQLAEHPQRYKETYYHEQKKQGTAPQMKDRTVWRKVAAFGSYVEQVNNLQPGQEIRVTAYPKEREVKHRDGTTGTTTDFFLIGIEEIQKP